MKKVYVALLFALAAQALHAQYWKTSGNGAANSNFLGTTNCSDLIFKTNNAERGRLTSEGTWRFGTSSNRAQFDVSGNLSFYGNAAYRVAGNSYVFRYSSNLAYGLYFNSSVPQYEFRNGSAVPVFYVNANTGNGAFKGTLKVGAYKLPSTDGANGQVLKTNGAGVLAWSNDNSGVTYTAGTGISIAGNVISNTGDANGADDANLFLSNLSSPTAVNQSLLPNTTNTKDFGSAGLSWKDIYVNGALYINGERYLANPAPGTGNILLGPGALTSLTSGIHNVAIGTNALAITTTGNNNTAAGYNSLANNSTGNFNTSAGSGSLFSNTTGSGNTATGVSSLYNNTAGTRNTATGVNVLFSNTTGEENTAVGYNSLYTNTTGSHNTVSGVSSMIANITGNNNTATGHSTLASNTSGSDNSTFGVVSLASNTTGIGNTASGAAALYSNTTGSDNTATGHDALVTNVTGSNNTAFGAFANVTTDGLDNATAIGYNAAVDASNKVRIGNTAVTSIGGQVGWTTFSDGRFKRNIKENVQGLQFINSLRPVTYSVDVVGLNNHYRKAANAVTNAKSLQSSVIADAKFKQATEEAGKVVETGFIAQEVEAAAQKIGYEFNGVDKPKTESGLYGLRYDEFVVPLVKAVQELSKTVDTKDAKIEAQQKQIDDLVSRLNKLELSLSQCCASRSAQSGSFTGVALNSNDAASLQQNNPNPFSRATTIHYTLPQTFTAAQIVVSDKAGKALKQIKLSGAGNGSLQVDAATLAAGAYNYSLYVDGKLIGSKQIVLAR